MVIILIILFIIFILVLSIYYIEVFVNLEIGNIKTKKEFIIGLIPFIRWFEDIIESWRNLK